MSLPRTEATVLAGRSDDDLAEGVVMAVLIMAERVDAGERWQELRELVAEILEGRL